MTASPVAVSEGDRVKLEEIDRALALGAASIPELIAQLEGPSWTVRRAVIAALGALGDPAVRPLLDHLVGHRDQETAIAATVDALVASVGDVETAVADVADQGDVAVLADVAQILGRRQRPRSLPLLVLLTEHPNDNVSVSAIEALGRMGGRSAVEPLVAAVQTGNFFRVFPTIDVLGRSGDPRAVPPLAALLTNRQYALEAARALGRSGDKSAVAPLCTMLLGPSVADARVAALALGDLAERFAAKYGTRLPIEESLRQAGASDVVVRRLVQALREADAVERLAMARVLGMLNHEASIAPLATLLHDADEAVITAAAESLRSVGRRPQDELGLALRQGDSRLRKLILPSVSSREAAIHVAICLDDEDAEVRVAACETLARIGNPGAVARLFRQLEEPNPAVAQAAAAAIQALGGPETEALAIAAARSESANVRRWALRILAYFGSAAAYEVCLAGLGDPDPRVRDSAIFGLPFIDDPRAREALFETTRAAVPKTRASAMRALGGCVADARVLAVLLRALSDPDAWVRYYACQSLGRLEAEGACEPIMRLLANESAHVRVAAVEALSHLRSQAAHDALVLAARSDDGDVRRAALIGLGLAARPEALPILLEAAAGDDVSAQLVALAALATYPDDGATLALGRAAASTDEPVRNAAIGFLAGRPGDRATAILVDMLGSQPGMRRLHEALAHPAPDRIKGLALALEASDDERALIITSALARMSRADAVTALVRSLRSTNLAARKAVATTLAGLGTQEAIGALRKAALEDPSPEVRRICALVLS